MIVEQVEQELKDQREVLAELRVDLALARLGQIDRRKLFRKQSQEVNNDRNELVFVKSRIRCRASAIAGQNGLSLREVKIRYGLYDVSYARGPLIVNEKQGQLCQSRIELSLYQSYLLISR